MKLIESSTIPGDYYHYCSGCNQMHCINTLRRNALNAQWSFNGNMDIPTFNPSIKILGDKATIICHYFIHSGQIEYCADSAHKLAGQRMELPEIPTELNGSY